MTGRFSRQDRHRLHGLRDLPSLHDIDDQQPGGRRISSQAPGPGPRHQGSSVTLFLSFELGTVKAPSLFQQLLPNDTLPLAFGSDEHCFQVRLRVRGL